MGGHSQARRTCAAVVWSLLLAVGLAGAEPAVGQGLFSPQSAVVLLAGVPGDVESEENYRDQLQSWLELAKGSGQAARIFVLCDDPQAVTLMGNPDAKSTPQEGKVSTNQPPAAQSPMANGKLPIANQASRITLLKSDRSGFLG